MKRNLVVFVMALSVMLSCESNSVSDSNAKQSPLPPSFKGYELYSWETDGHWSYTLITGTNRNKEYDEIVSTDNVEGTEWVKISVYDLADLKRLLSRLPANESIFWINSANRILGFSLPKAPVIMQVEKHCQSLHVHLQIIQ